jgi:large subunit ribosomal protein L25
METVLKAQTRDGRGKGDARKLRAQGLVPGVLYGHGVAPVAISLASQDLLHFFHANHGAATVVDLDIDGKKHMAIPREIQRDHLHGRYVHIDFLAVRGDEKVKMSVEIHETGEAPGVKTGGVIEHHLRDVEIECLPGDVPEQITADISGLELGDMLRLGDIPEPSGVTYLTDPETPVISVVTPAALRTEADLLLPGEEAPEEAAPEAAEEPGAEGEGGAEAAGESAPEPES